MAPGIFRQLLAARATGLLSYNPVAFSISTAMSCITKRAIPPQSLVKRYPSRQEQKQKRNRVLHCSRQEKIIY